ncbi:cytochrome P450 [uncultured Alteromonas sp.]|uniref:cytochrome P450 n=1 Tax=uncultured Alteromonas sp. TaxID=179113 RepID=UPI0025D61E0D|nr:cytochrome P450 [uncultured Alteromonas sp.]
MVAPLGSENLSKYEKVTGNVGNKVLVALSEKKADIDLVTDIEEPLFLGIVQQVFGFVPGNLATFLRDVDISLKVAEPVQSVKTLLKIQDALTRIIGDITAQLNLPNKPGLLYDIYNTLRSGTQPHSTEQIAATIAILLIASRTTSETISHIVIKNSELSVSIRKKFSNPEWVSTHFQSFVRFCASTEFLTRVASAEIKVDDVTLKADEAVFIHVPSTNRDQRHHRSCEYAQLDEGAPERHLAFGAGVHRCPGQYLAQQLIVSFIPKLYAQFPAIFIEPGSVKFKSSLLARRVSSARVVLLGAENGIR